MKEDHSLDWIAVLAATVLLLMIYLIVTSAYAADSTYCSLWAREKVRLYIRAMTPEGLAEQTVDSLQFKLTQMWTLCLNRDDPPEITLDSEGKWAADIYSQIQRTLPKPAGTVPASNSVAVPNPAADRPPPPAQPPSTKVAAADHPQPLCLAHRMRTVYEPNGLSWRCRR